MITMVFGAFACCAPPEFIETSNTTITVDPNAQNPTISVDKSYGASKSNLNNSYSSMTPSYIPPYNSGYSQTNTSNQFNPPRSMFNTNGNKYKLETINDEEINSYGHLKRIKPGTPVFISSGIGFGIVRYEKRDNATVTLFLRLLDPSKEINEVAQKMKYSVYFCKNSYGITISEIKGYYIYCSNEVSIREFAKKYNGSKLKALSGDTPNMKGVFNEAMLKLEAHTYEDLFMDNSVSNTRYINENAQLCISDSDNKFYFLTWNQYLDLYRAGVGDIVDSGDKFACQYPQYDPFIH